jgi:RHS repeat-associated protein
MRIKLSNIFPIITAIGLLLLIAISYSDQLSEDPVKITPLSVTINNSVSEEAWSLFDMDTTTSFKPSSRVLLKVEFPGSFVISQIRVYGSSSFLLNIYRVSESGLEPIPELLNIDTKDLKNTWNTFPISEPINISSIAFEIIPAGNNLPELREIEIWGLADTVKDGSSTLSLHGIRNAREIEDLISTMPSHILEFPSEPIKTSESGLSAEVSLHPSPLTFKRAYLLYEVYGIPSPVGVKRRVNGLSWSGGFQIPETRRWFTHIEEINPDWLIEGRNLIEFEGALKIRNMRLVAETDSGWNSVSYVSETSIYDGDLNTPLNPISTAEIGFDRPVIPRKLLFYLKEGFTGTVSIQYKRNNIWFELKNAVIETDKPGWHSIDVPEEVVTESLRLLSKNLPLTELRISTSVTGSVEPEIIVSYPRDGEYFGRSAFIQGFVRPHATSSGLSRIGLFGRPATGLLPDGAFSLEVVKDETPFSGTSDDTPWAVRIDAGYSNPFIVSQSNFKPKVSKEIKLTDNLLKRLSLSSQSTSNYGRGYRERVSPGQPKKINFRGVTIDIPEGALDVETDIVIIPLTEPEIERLNPGMTNVTYPDAGYRFLPHGLRFKKPVKITIGYSRQRFLKEQKDEDVNMYFYNESLLRWQALTRDNVNSGLQKVTAITDHFTDIINATLVVPEHPQALTYNPNSIKDIKSADPSAGYNLIEAPQVNNTGDLRLSYPIEVPHGRNGLQPNLTIVYNSSGGNGWLGLGWDLSISNITIDTRWGVPRYDMAKETENYLLDGEALSPVVVHKQELPDRMSERVFHTRVEGQFRMVIRHGNSPKNYWWEVIDKNGTRYIYGDTSDSRLGSSEGIFRWALRQVRDSNGNTIDYEYRIIEDSGTGNGDGPVMGYNLYPHKIYYTGHGNLKGPYSIRFILDIDLKEKRRPDSIIDGRGGFKMVIAHLLRKIEISFENKQVRSYELRYQKGEFSKSLLKEIVQYGANNTEFNRHEFEYYNDVLDINKNYKGFSESERISTGDDSISAGLLDYGKATAISGVYGKNKGGHLYLGVNCIKGPQKKYSGGFKTGYSESKNKGLLQLIDIDGDNIPDKVFKEGGSYYYRSGKSKYKEKQRLTGFPGLLIEESKTTSSGGEAYLGLNFMYNESTTFTRSTTYFSDVNGDGLIDVVKDGVVYFNYLSNGVPSFTPDSSLTPLPVGKGQLDTDGIVDDYSTLYENMIDQNPLIDAVRRWIAPYDGYIKISGPVTLIKDSSEDRAEYKTADGVKVTIQHNGTELWSTMIGPEDYNPKTPSGLERIRVRKGDRLYFRVHSIYDGLYDKVNWDPQITYLDVQDTRDANNLNPYVFRASDDFIMAGRKGKLTVPFTGTLRLAGRFHKLQRTTDDIKLAIFKNGDLIYEETIPWNETGERTMEMDISVEGFSEHYSGDTLRWHVFIDSPVDMKAFSWEPEAYYISLQGNNGSIKDPDGNYLIQLYPSYGADIYLNDLQEPQGFWKATRTGRLLVVPSLTVDNSFRGSTEVFLTAKKRGELLGKSRIIVSGSDEGVYVSPESLLFINVNAGDELLFDLTTRDKGLRDYLIEYSVRVSYQIIPLDDIYVPSAFNYTVEADVFPVPYRGWGFIGYNGNRQWGEMPIDETILDIEHAKACDRAINNNEDAKECAEDGLKRTRVFLLSPFPHTDIHSEVQKRYWIAPPESWGMVDPELWIKASEMSSSRFGTDYIWVPTVTDYLGAEAPSRLAKGKYTTLGTGISFSDIGIGLNVSKGEGNSYGEVDFIDMNGDRFPDLVAKSKIQFTDMTRGLSNVIAPGGGIRENSSNSYGLGLGGTPLTIKPDSKGRNGSPGSPTGEEGNLMLSLGLSGNFSNGVYDGEMDLIDINGDGLPDRVFSDGRVSLNLGYKFAPPEDFNAMVNSGSHLEDSIGVSPGFNDGIYGFAGGISLGANVSKTKSMLADINGDGLPDRVWPGSDGLDVSFNTGSGYLPPVDWIGGFERLAENDNITLGGGLYFTIGIPIPLTPCFIIINPGGELSESISRQQYGLIDINGDGYPDHVASNDDSELQVAYNNTGRTNLLKTVYRPLGGKISIDYQRVGNTYEMPQSKWVLSRVVLTDGMGNSYKTLYKYEHGYYDRFEREFYGFREVIETQSPDSPEERSIIRTYHNNNYYLKGLLIKTVTKDKDGNVWVRTDNTYELIDVMEDSKFPGLTKTTNYFYDGTKTDEGLYEKFTYQQYSYDSYGNIIYFYDSGDEGTDDDLQANISYFMDRNAYIMKPNMIEVRDLTNNRLLRKRHAQYEQNTGNLLRLTQIITPTQNAVWQMTYDEYGNLRTITDPVGYRLTYTYDPYTHTYITRTEDNFPPSKGGPYYSLSEYDLRFGQIKKTMDLSGNWIYYDYDEFGRLTGVWSPYDTDRAGNPLGRATIEFQYIKPELSGINELKNRIIRPASAITHNKAVFMNGSDPDTIDTVTFVDGMQRIIQTKKEAEVNGRYGMVLSGKIGFDNLGRVIYQGQPEFEPGYSTEYSSISVPKNPTFFSYDTIDRTVKIIAPDGATTTTRYTFGEFSGKRYALTITKDPEGNRPGASEYRGRKDTYRDVDDRIIAVIEYNNSQAIKTRYRYNPLGEIIQITDDRGNTTTIEYDLMGRRLAITNPDTGRTEYDYDANGNLISKLTANYQRGKETRYIYYFNRLERIDYPESPDVEYEYGAMLESYNRAGRIKHVTDESGEERYYGRLGEITKEIKRVNAHTPSASRKRYTTEYLFDSFGRLLELVYPDGERLRYHYDRGGLLKSVYGEKAGIRYEYIKVLRYDEFGQRTYIEYGNGVKSTYGYDPLTRRLKNLLTEAPDGRVFQNLHYTYDLVGNILTIKNLINTPTQTALPAGPVIQEYNYDDLYQLTEARGHYNFGPGKQNLYTNRIEYDTIGNITLKEQRHWIRQPSLEPHYPKETNYVLNYIYGSPKPHAVTDTGDKLYTYDPAGNMTGWTHKQNGTRRVIYWNEENRVKQIDDNGKKTYFLYDDTGERVLKRGEHGETLYINRFYSIRNGELSTKHVFAGETRILSKLVKTPPTSDSNTDPTFPGSRGILNALGRGKGNKFGIFKRIDQGELPATLPVEKDQFYYHTDHLGSSNIITDTYGSVYQHLEYFPYGETWIEDGGTGQMPYYRFTGKELDPETGLYYYGARYYDPVLSRWISADPIFGKYLPNLGKTEHGDLPAFGGIYNPINLNMYCYSFNNPLKYKDPDGNFAQIVWGFATGVIADVGIQYLEAKIKGQEFKIDIKQAIISGASGAATGGLSMVSKAAKLGKLAKVALEAADIAKDTAASIASQVNDSGDWDIATTVGDVALGQAGGKVSKKVVEKAVVPLKIQERQLDRLQRITTKNPRASRETAIREAQRGLQTTKNIIVSGETAGDRAASGILDVSKAVVENFSTPSQPAQFQPADCHEQ